MEVTGIKGNSNNLTANGVNSTDTAAGKTKDSGKKDDHKTSNIINSNELNFTGKNDSKLKKLFAQKSALETQLDQFNKDSKTEDKIEEHKDKRESLLKDAGENRSEVNRLKGLEKDVKDAYCVEDDSQEQKDLELLEKREEGTIPLTKDELDRIAHMGPMTDYQSAALDYYKAAKTFRKRAEKEVENSFNETKTINGIKLNQLRNHPMIDAKKEVKGMLDQVDQEIQNEIFDELKKKVNENLDINPQDQILPNAQTLIKKKKATEDDIKGLAVDEKV